MMVDTAFTRDGDRFLPTPLTRSPWDPQSLHGRVLAGLLAHAIETRHGDPAFQIARLTVDLYRAAPLAPVTVETSVARDGNRVRVVDATVRSDGVDVARASALMLRRAPQPQGHVWSPPPWEVPHPESLPPAAPRNPGGYTATWEQRPIAASAAGAKRVWIRERVALIDGAPPSAVVRAAQVADFANPFANMSDRGLEFVNADITLYMDREPRGEWIGVEVATHLSADGIAIGECALFDLEGPFGRNTVCGVANRRP